MKTLLVLLGGCSSPSSSRPQAGACLSAPSRTAARGNRPPPSARRARRRRAGRGSARPAPHRPARATSTEKPAPYAASPMASPPAAASAQAKSARQRSSQIASSTTCRAPPSLSGLAMTNTGRPAGWSGRSTNGSRAITLGASGSTSRIHHAPAAAPPSSANMPRSPPLRATDVDHADGAEMRHHRHGEAEMEALAVADRRFAAADVDMHGVGRLHVGEGRDDDAPDALDGVDRQPAGMALDDGAQHRGLARRPERGAAALRAA